MVEVNCETDFVSKNDSFLAFAKACAELVASTTRPTWPRCRRCRTAQDGFGPTVEDVRKGLIGKIGENMSIRRFKRYAGGGKLAHYLHGTRIGVMVEFDGRRGVAAKDVAMHVAAMKPAALSSADVPAELVEKERKIASREGGRKRQAGRDRRQDGRRLGAEVPEGGLAAGPGLRQGRRRQADREQPAEGQGHHGEGLHAVRGGRGHREEGRTTSLPKWRPRWPLPRAQ
jgi:translation elongation factor Ts